MAAHQSNRQAGRLIHGSSPCLLLHACNPVDRHPWRDDAWAKAREEGKPVLGSAGHGNCHWCHVMGREYFADETIAGPDALPLHRRFGAHPVPNALFFGCITNGNLLHSQYSSLPSSTIFVCVEQACQLPVATVDEALNPLP